MVANDSPVATSGIVLDASYTQVALSASGAILADFSPGFESAMGETLRAWRVAKILCDDGSRGKCGRVLQAEQYHVSVAIICGVESFYEIDQASFILLETPEM